MRKQVPKNGATRVTRKFLWLPKTLEVKDLGIRQRRWLEWAWIEQKHRIHIFGSFLDFWEDRRFFC